MLSSFVGYGTEPIPEHMCEESYGFLPCSSSLFGSLFLMALYGYFLLKGAGLMSDGSELLLEVLDPGLIGGLFLPVLGATPDAIMILVAGLGCAPEVAAQQVAVGLGTLCGSTVMLLTIAWGGSVMLGRCDLNARGRAIDNRITRPWYDVVSCGVTADSATRHGSWIMMATSLIYLIVQVPAALGYQYDPAAAVAGAVVCLLTLIAYAAYQVLYPELQRRKIEAARQSRHKWLAISKLHVAFPDLVDDEGRVSRVASDHVFDVFDTDHSGFIDHSELKGLLAGLSLTGGSEAAGWTAEVWVREFDRDNSNSICKEEFFNGLQKWILEKLRATGGNPQWLAREFEALGVEGLSDEEGSDAERALLAEDRGASGDLLDEGPGVAGPLAEEAVREGKAHIVLKAVALLAAGTLLCSFTADPMVEAVSSFAAASGIPAFYISFVVTPMASNASELVSSLYFARKKRKTNISLTFAQVYGAVTMNNSLCLGLFLMVVYVQRLPWVYTSEVIVTIGATFVLGAITARHTTFRVMWALPVLAMYPLSVFMIHWMDNVWGIQ